jgi:uncharacterized membrane protein YhhN
MGETATAPPRSSTLRFAALPFVIVSVLHVVALAVGTSAAGADVVGADALSAATKPMLMPALALALVVALRRRGPVLALAGAALLFSWFGDLSLSVTDGPGFLVGLGCFFVAHLAWIVLFARLGPVALPGSVIRPEARVVRWQAVLLAAWWLAFVALLAPHTGALLAPVAFYGLVLGAMAALALGAGRLTGAGGVLFVLSDSLLGLHTFLPGFEFPGVDALIMLSYLAAQALLVLGVVRRRA